MKVSVKSPGTCGEYIQGWYQGSPCLISCPIDCYSITTIEDGHFSDNALKAKSQAMVDLLLAKNYFSKEAYQKISIRVKSDIPKGKGMASSTADLAGVATALSLYFELGLTPSKIGKLCTMIEPSDNLMFAQLNLFDHLSGRVLKEIAGVIEAKVLIIDFHGRIDTLSFNETQDDYSAEELQQFSEIIKLFEQGVKEKDLFKIGRACTNSACLNQKRLYKADLDEIIELMENYKGLGIVVGHSGTVIGVIYDEQQFEKEAFLAALKKKISGADYKDIYDHSLIKGGVEILAINN